MADRPTLVVVAGHPASGKTTVAQALAGGLRLPLVCKDAIKEVLFDVLGAGDLDWSHRLGRAAMLLLHQQATGILTSGSSVVVEAPFERDVSTPDLRKVLDDTGARALRVVLTAHGAELVERYQRRSEDPDRHPGHVEDVWTEDLIGRLSSPYEPPELPGPLLEVDCNDLAELDLKALVEQVGALLES